MEVSDVSEVKLFTVEDGSGHFFLGAVFAHDFQEDRAIAMEDFVYTFGSFHSHFVELYVIHGFASGRTENLIGSAGKRFFTKSAESLMSGVGFRVVGV